MKNLFVYLLGGLSFVLLFFCTSCSVDIIGTEYTCQADVSEIDEFFISKERRATINEERYATIKFYDNGQAMIVAYNSDDDEKYFPFVNRSSLLTYKKEGDDFVLSDYYGAIIAKCSFSNGNRKLKLLYSGDEIEFTQSHRFAELERTNQVAGKYYLFKSDSFSDESMAFIDDSLVLYNDKLKPYDLENNKVYIEGTQFELEGTNRLNISYGFGTYSFKLEEENLSEYRVKEFLISIGEADNGDFGRDIICFIDYYDYYDIRK